MNGAGMQDDDSNMISINNKVQLGQQRSTIPMPVNQMLYRDQSQSITPEKDPMYDTQANTFGGRRRRTIGGAKLDPIPVMSNFLRKGQGNGGSPTNFVLRRNVNESGQVMLEPIAKRQGALSTVRTRHKSGSYQYN